MKRSNKITQTGSPDPTRIQQLAGEALSTIKAVQESMHRDVSVLHEERERLDAQLQDFEQNHIQIMDIKSEVDMQRNELSVRASEMESLKLELQRQESELVSRTQQLEDDAAEQAAMRDTLTTLQVQLTRDQEEIAAQREELIKRLGSTTPSSSKNTKTEPVDESPEPEETEPQGESPMKASPKPASGADQFRKLRRDAKRKAIGV